MRPRLIFSDPDAERVERLRRGIGDHPDLRVIHLKSSELRKLPELDAIFLTIMAAEAWGAVPLIHKAQVLTNRENRLAGWPDHIVAGVAMGPGDPREPVFELKLIIQAVLEAITEFNQESEQPITSVGFSPEWTGINRIDPIQAGRIIRELYDSFA